VIGRILGLLVLLLLAALVTWVAGSVMGSESCVYRTTLTVDGPRTGCVEPELHLHPPHIK
jgi:hypothetical protein